MNKRFKDLFISYGRRESLGFVGRLHQQLKLAGYDAWFDKVNIPDGDDYAQRIQHGIESAHNIVYVMAPRCLTSPYCLLELEYARFLGKRLIPVNQMVIFNTDLRVLSEKDQQVLANFYQAYQLPAQEIQTTQQVLDRSLALIGKTDWLDAKEHLTDDDCQRLANWAQSYENHWAKHEDLDDLNTFEFPIFGKPIDTLDSVIERITAVLERQSPYIHKHTEILSDVLWWQKNQKARQHLLVGKERMAAEEWLLTEFLPPKQPPCQPTPLICEYICEARKNAENLMTDLFICYDVHHDKAIRDSVVRSLSRYAKTTWCHDHDIRTGDHHDRAIEQGIENADNFCYFISPHAVVSVSCRREFAHALKYNKRIIPLLIAPTLEADLPEALRHVHFIDFTDNTCQADYDSDIDDLLNILRHDQDYYKQHKILLSRALKWRTENYQPSFLLRGHNLDNAKTWLRLNKQREHHPPLDLHKKLITASEAAKGQLGTEVFISYSRKDSDFARHLNTALQEAGKTTWFDQESLSSGVDFAQEIFKGIDSANNFVFVISPDAVQSDYCEREVNYAVEQNKRFISVLHRKTDSALMPQALQIIQWIDFKDFDKAFQELIQAIELDRDHAHQHTVLQQRASDWTDNHRSKEFLLNITACQNAETWRDHALENNKQPTPTRLQREFIQESREAIRAANKRRNIFLSFVGLLAGVAVVLAIVAVNKMQEAEEQTHIAFVEKLGAQAILAAHLPSPSNGYYEQAGLLAVQAFREKDNSVSRSNVLRVLQAKKQNKVFLYGHLYRVQNVAFSPDGKTLASGSIDGTVRLWDVATRQPLEEPFRHSGGVTSVVFSPDGKTLASGGWDGTVRLWDVATRQPLGEPLAGHSEGVWSVAFSPDGKMLASGSSDKTVRLWDVATRQPLGEPLAGHSESIESVAFSPDGKVLALGSWDNTVRLWDVATRQPLGEPLAGHSEMFSSVVAFSPDGKMLASGNADSTIRLWDVATRKPLGEPLAGHPKTVNSVAFSPDGKTLASGSWDNTVRLWDVATRQPLGEPLDGHSGVNSVAFSPDGKALALGSEDKTVRLWDIAPRQPLGELLAEHSNGVMSVAFSPDGKTLASASRDNTVRLWDVATQHPLGEPLARHSWFVSSVAFSPDGKTLASGSTDKTVRLWDVATQHPLGEPLVGHSKTVNSVAFSPDGKTLASGSWDNTVRLWDVAIRQPLGESLTGHSEEVSSVAFSPDSKVLASGSEDKTVRLWDIATRQLLGEPLVGHSEAVNSVAFSPDGKTLASGSTDKTVRLWDVNVEPWLKRLCFIVNRNLSQTEWHQYMGERPHEKTCPDLPEDTLGALHSIQQGEELAKEGKIEAAVMKFKEVQGLDAHFVISDPQSKAKQLAAQGLIEQGESLAKKGEIDQAIAKFKEAQRLDSSLNFDPQSKAKQLAAQGLTEQGEFLAKKGEIDQAIAKFKEAQRLDSSLNFDPQSKAKQLAAQGLIEQGSSFAIRGGKIDQAIAKFKEAQQMDAHVEISAYQWKTLCWFGSIYGQAAKVMDTCEKAVALAPEDGNIRDSRALAKALVGDIQAAIKDFQFALENSDDEEYKTTRRAWVMALEKGENPFTEEVLKGLR